MWVEQVWVKRVCREHNWAHGRLMHALTGCPASAHAARSHVHAAHADRRAGLGSAAEQ